MLLSQIIENHSVKNYSDWATWWRIEYTYMVCLATLYKTGVW